MNTQTMIQTANARLSAAVSELSEVYEELDCDGFTAMEKLEELGELVGDLEAIEYRLELLAPSNEQ